MIYPKNWGTFQHYKNRNPPWIKLHKTLLDDANFQRLPVASKALAPMLWLLASESLDGGIADSPDDLAFRLRMTTQDFLSAFKPLEEKGFFIDASGMLADCKQLATPETEKEKETKAKREAKASLPEELKPRLEALVSRWPGTFQKDGKSIRLPKVHTPEDLFERMVKFNKGVDVGLMIAAGEKHLSAHQTSGWDFSAPTSTFTIAMCNFYGQQNRWKEFR